MKTRCVAHRHYYSEARLKCGSYFRAGGGTERENCERVSQIRPEKQKVREDPLSLVLCAKKIRQIRVCVRARAPELMPVSFYYAASIIMGLHEEKRTTVASF